jgi:uncharacterized protein (TIGR02996 family)
VTEREALLAAVLDSPDDDLPRLVYADWLDENGPLLPGCESAADRAALIRLQVEQARTEPYSPAWREAGAKARELMSRHYSEWTLHLPEWVIEAQFRRGFLEHVTVEAVRFAHSAGFLFESEPVREVRAARFLQSAEWESIEPFFAAPELAKIRRLEFAPATLVNVEFDALAASPYLAGLRELSFSENLVPPAWITDLLMSERLPNLAGLALSEVTNLGPAVAEGICRGLHRRLANVNLSGVWFTSPDLKRMLASPVVKNAEELHLAWDGNPANPGPLVHLDLGWVLPWNRLRVLDISGQGVGLDGVREIAWKPDAAQLRYLGLASNGIGRGGVLLLLDSPYLNLFYLDIRDNELRPRDVERLRKRFPDAEVVA